MTTEGRNADPRRPGAGAAGPGPRHPFRKSLRNPNINYRNGWFFVTTQVAHNKCAFGAVVGGRCVLNALGEAVRDCWLALPAKYPEAELDEFVVMPNHFHAILRIRFRRTNKEHHLGFLMSRFKGSTGHTYGVMRAEARTPDIGPHLWQFDYWDDLISDEAEIENQRRYIRNNPANWTRDRYGPCTSHSFGNLALLDVPRIAFVASQGFPAAALAPRRARAEAGAEAPRSDIEQKVPCSDIEQKAPCSDIEQKAPRSDIEQKAPCSDIAQKVHCSDIEQKAPCSDIEAAGFSPQDSAIISTFTSAQEREVLRRALAKGRLVIQVCPSGVPAEVPVEAGRSDIEQKRNRSDIEQKRNRSDMEKEVGRSDIGAAGFSPHLLKACREGRALIISPQPPGSRLNKKVAAWCNEYVLRHANEVWVGDISPGGLLDTLLKQSSQV